MGLNVIHGTAQRVKERLEKRIRQAASTNENELNAACTKRILTVELNNLQSMWPQGNIPSFNSSTMKKTDLIKALCSYRKKYFRLFPGTKQQISDNITVQEQQASGTNRAELEEEFDDMFFQLAPATAINFDRAATIKKFP